MAKRSIRMALCSRWHVILWINQCHLIMGNPCSMRSVCLWIPLSTGISTEVQHRFCPLHSSYHYTNSTPILPRPQLMPGTRDSYSLAQIPVCTTLWYQLVHTTSWSALSAWTLNFSLSVMVLPWHTSRTAESPSHPYFSFLPSSLSIVSESLTLLPSTLVTVHLIC